MLDAAVCHDVLSWTHGEPWRRHCVSMRRCGAWAARPASPSSAWTCSSARRGPSVLLRHMMRGGPPMETWEGPHRGPPAQQRLHRAARTSARGRARSATSRRATQEEGYIDDHRLVLNAHD